jgi:site-specific DNA recombinase
MKSTPPCERVYLSPMKAKPKDLQQDAPGYAVYTRLSVDRDGAQTATKRQEDDARKLATDRGWTVGEVYSDVDLSAFDKRVRRPGFEAMLETVAAGHHSGIVVWKMDRLVRQPRDLERVLDVLEASGAGLASVHDPVDVSGPMGLAMLRIGVVMAKVESSNISIRTRRKAEELARAGAVSGGGTRPFGYSQDRRTIIEPEARMIRAAATLVLAGESIRAIARQWNDAGMPTPTGKRWAPSVVSRILRAPLIAGLREHHGEIVAEGSWPAIIDRETHDRLAVALDPRTRRTSGAGRPRSYLLTGGIVRCALCGVALVARPREDGRRRYVCASGPGWKGCGGITIMAEELEQVIAEAVIERLASPTFAAELATARKGDERGDLFREQAQLEGRLDELAADYYAAGGLTRSEYATARQALVDRVEQVQARLARLGGGGVLAALPRGEGQLRAAWTAGSLDWRRRVVSAVLDHVTIGSAVRGRNTFDVSRVGVVWRQERDDELRDAA